MLKKKETKLSFWQCFATENSLVIDFGRRRRIFRCRARTPPCLRRVTRNSTTSTLFSLSYKSDRSSDVFALFRVQRTCRLPLAETVRSTLNFRRHRVPPRILRNKYSLRSDKTRIRTCVERQWPRWRKRGDREEGGGRAQKKKKYVSRES